MENESLRTFIAVDMPAESRRALRALQDSLKKGSRAPVKWVDPDSVHLTLKFLGSTQAGMVPRILDVMAGAVRGVKPFTVELKGLGAFPEPEPGPGGLGGLERGNREPGPGAGQHRSGTGAARLSGRGARLFTALYPGPGARAGLAGRTAPPRRAYLGDHFRRGRPVHRRGLST